MNDEPFKPTLQQEAVISHHGSAFVRACPGAGKTRVLAERARVLFKDMPPGRGVAFLSFTQAAVFELGLRLRQEGILALPAFPSFIGTFDSFVWQFLIAPFGVRESNARPQLIPDIEDLRIAPFQNAHPLPLSCFDPQTSEILPEPAKLQGFDTSTKKASVLKAYETAARDTRAALRTRGHLGFDQARFEALARLKDPILSPRIAAALASRFREVIVDEAQDCNPADLEFISWLRQSGLPVKVVCDPHQCIYEFRGGVTDHLVSFSNTFTGIERKELTGNFRSSPNICRAICQLRPPAMRGAPDQSLGHFKVETTPIHILSYSGTAVPASIGSAFTDLLRHYGLDVSGAPILAATRASGAAAVGQPQPSNRRDRAVRLAEAVTTFHFAAGFNDMRAALNCVHEIVLELEGHLDGVSYHQYVSDNDLKIESWRPKVIALLRGLRFDPTKHDGGRAWHAAAKDLIAKRVTPATDQSVSQRLRWNSAIEATLAAAPTNAARRRTIHSVKGMEFPAVCVVTTSNLKGILSYLETGAPADRAKDARRLYVAASRAQRLLAFAAPKGQAERLGAHLRAQGAILSVADI